LLIFSLEVNTECLKKVTVIQTCVRFCRWSKSYAIRYYIIKKM